MPMQGFKPAVPKPIVDVTVAPFTIYFTFYGVAALLVIIGCCKNHLAVKHTEVHNIREVK